MNWQKWLDILQNLPWAKQWRLLAGVTLILGGFIGFGMWAYSPDFAPLFNNLPEKEAGAVISVLEQNAIPYKLSPNGALLVERSKLYETRYRLAAQGLPKHTEETSIDPPQFGATSQQEMAYQQKMKEQELAKSIMSIAGISSARVHLALPKQTIFGKETTAPSASVILDPRYPLTRAQSSAIAKLISGSIPGLDPQKVSIIDSQGRLLEAQNDLSGSTPEQKQMINETRQDYKNRIERLLESIAGKGSVRAEVDVDMDFANEESVVETWKPNSGEASIRSAKFLEKRNGQPTAGGVPGSPTNFPPSALPPLPGTAVSPSASSPSSSTSKTIDPSSNGQVESVVNYEVDRSVVKSTNQVHKIKKITAAVLVNVRKTVGKDGKTTSVPFSPAEIDQFQSLVKETIGYSIQRGDSVQVLNMAFADEPIIDDSLPIWKDPYYLNFAPTLIKILISIFFGLALLKQSRKLIMAFMTQAKPEPPPPSESTDNNSPQSNQPMSDSMLNANGSNAPAETNKMDTAAVKQLAQNNPQAVANLIKEWVEGEDE